MAESAYCDTSNPYIKYWMEVTETSVDTENNTSTVNVKVYATRINDYPEATNYSGLCYLYFYNESTGEWEDKGDNDWDYPDCPIWSGSDKSATTFPVSASLITVPLGTPIYMSSPYLPLHLEPLPFSPF